MLMILPIFDKHSRFVFCEAGIHINSSPSTKPPLNVSGARCPDIGRWICSKSSSIERTSIKISSAKISGTNSHSIETQILASSSPGLNSPLVEESLTQEYGTLASQWITRTPRLKISNRIPSATYLDISPSVAPGTKSRLLGWVLSLSSSHLPSLTPSCPSTATPHLPYHRIGILALLHKAQP